MGCRFDSPSWEGPDGWAAQRNKDLWQTFDAVLSLCRSEKVEFLFLTGDLFEQEYVHKETVERVARSLAKLNGTKIFIAPGERDPFVTTSAYRLAVWPSNVHIFSSGISSVKIPSQNVTVYGAGWTAYHQEGSFLDGFQSTRDGTIPIMLLHAEVDSVKNTEGFIPILPEHIASSGLAYLALGHQEGWSGIQKAGETVWADSGFLEARSFSESGPHGVIIGEIEQDSARFEFRELGQRHYIEKTLAFLSNIEALTTKLLSETSPEERQRDLFRVKLSGPFRKVEAAVHPLQKLLANKFRFIEVVHNEGETNSRFGPDVVTPLEKMTGNEDGYPTLPKVFINKLKERQVTAVSTETHEHWELVMKIGLAALGQGRIDDEN
jgi:DNA repair exonuclease SbcCD nuclease subunit